MKKILMSLGIASLLALPVISAPVSAAQPVAEIKGQPNMQAAIVALESAQAALKKAKTNKGGHRVAALKLIKQAIKEVKEGAAHAKDKNKAKKKKGKK